jgi:RHS repeat-associated protein
VVEYRAQRAGDASFSSGVFTGTWTSGLSYPFTGLNGGCQAYYYRLQSRDALSNTSTWSTQVVSSTQDAVGTTGSVIINGWPPAVGGSLYYVHQDLLGSTVAVSDAAGGEVGRVQYDPYGEVLTSTLPADLTDWLFTGQRLDSSSGLYYYNARYYDPHLGRFIQPDSLVPDPLNPRAWNRFSYCGNNPTSYVDPGGHIAWVPILIFGGAFLLGAGAGGYYAYHQGYGFESWQLYAYAGMGGLAGVAGAATGMWIEAALLPAGATVGQAMLAGAAGGFAAGAVEQSILEVGGAAILGTEVSAERILLAGATGGITGGLSGMASRWLRLRGATRAPPLTEAEKATLRSQARQEFLRAHPRLRRLVGTFRLEVHHRIPLRYAHLFSATPKVHANRLSNLYGLERSIHRSVVNPAWDLFAAANPNPTVAQILEFAMHVDELIAPYINQFPY